MLRTLATVITLSIVLVGGAAAAQTDELSAPPSIDKLLKDALDAHKAGKSQEAIGLLQRAIDVIQREGVKSLGAFVPPIPEGWEADEPKTVTGNWGAGAQAFQWSQVSRTYRRKSDGMRVDVQITNSPQLIMPQKQMASMFANEQYVKMMNSDPNKTIKSFKKEGWTGWTILEKGRNANGVALSDKLMLTLEVRPGEQEIFTKFWQKVDFDGLRGAQ